MEYRISNKLKELKPSAIREIFKSLTDPEIIPFAAGNPSPESFPAKELAALASEIFETEPAKALQYGITEGYPPFRNAVAERLRRVHGIGNDNDMTIIVSGGQQGIELTCKTLCDEGDAVICENPSFIGALNSFRSLGARTVGVPLEDDGMNLEALKKTIKETPDAKFMYLIPNFQNPAGTTMSLEKRKAVYEIALENGLMILEDDPYGELRFAGEYVPSIKSLDRAGIVIYCTSFSKILSAGMRVGVLCAPAEVMQKIVVAKQGEDVHTNQFFQMLCERFVTKCDLEGHIAKIREIYKAKCELMLSELDANMPECVKYSRPEGGLFIYAKLPPEISLDELVKKALAKKVAIVPGTAFNCDLSEGSDSFRLNYSTPSDEQIVRGIRVLSDIIKEMLG